jgi:hypothetical protein
VGRILGTVRKQYVSAAPGGISNETQKSLFHLKRPRESLETAA